MSETPDEIKTKMLKLVNSWTFEEDSDNALAATMEGEKIHLLARIATALEKIEKTGIYVYQQGTQDDPESDTVQSDLGRRQG